MDRMFAPYCATCGVRRLLPVHRIVASDWERGGTVYLGFKADNLGGSLRVHMGKGDFSAHSIAGDLTLQGRMDDVSISDVQGVAGLEGDFFGDTNAAHITGAVHFHSSRTDVQLVRRLPMLYLRLVRASTDPRTQTAAAPC